MMPTAALLLLVSAARAQTTVGPLAPPPFVPNMIASVSLSLKQQPFYASMLLNAFDFHLARSAAMTEPRAAAYLKEEILGLGPAAKTPAALMKRLGQEPLEDHRAAALLLANAAARPDQFREVLDGLEDVRPGLGKALQARLAAGGDASGRLADRFRRLGAAFAPRGSNAIYGPDGRLETLFDATPEYPAF